MFSNFNYELTKSNWISLNSSFSLNQTLLFLPGFDLCLHVTSGERVAKRKV